MFIETRFLHLPSPVRAAFAVSQQVSPVGCFCLGVSSVSQSVLTMLFLGDVTPTGFEMKDVTFFYRDVTPTGFIPDFSNK